MLIMFCLTSFNTSLSVHLHETYEIPDELIGPYQLITTVPSLINCILLPLVCKKVPRRL